jgi:hypothetical protein
MAAFLTGKGIIDDAMSIIRNNSVPVRAKMLLWLNVTAQKLTTARSWQFPVNSPAIEDTEEALSWPPECQPMFIRSLLDFFYEYDMDERQAMSYQLNQVELGELKKWDNRQKPRQRYERHGYRGAR